MGNREDYPIDFVVTWVDGSDEEWIAQKNKYLEKNTTSVDVRKRRFRNWDNFQYWFRGVERFAPWVNHIYLVTAGHYPKWLNLSDPKLTLITHDVIFDEKYLPTFNNCAIELLMHKIPGLSEHFVYFNDDTFLTSPVEPSDFFMNGLPRDTVGFAANPLKVDESGKGICNIAHTNTILVSRFFDKDEVFRNNRRKFLSLKNGRDLIKTLTSLPYKAFVGFNEPHTANSFLKSTFEDMWDKAPVEMEQVVSSRFRGDYSLSQWGVRYWQICMGNFELRKRHFSQLFKVAGKGDAMSAADCIVSGKRKVVCINDDVEDDDSFADISMAVINALQKVLPDKSSFEV